MTTISSHLVLLAITILVVGIRTTNVSAENEIYESRGIKSGNGGENAII
jgi:hypothetical protein